MSLFDRLLAQLKQRGLSVEAGEKPGELKLVGPAKERTPELMTALKAFRPLLLERFGIREPATQAPKDEPKAEPDPEPESQTCPLCQRVTDAEDRQHLRGVNPFCSQGFAKAATDAHGIEHSMSHPCPFRGRDS